MRDTLFLTVCLILSAMSSSAQTPTTIAYQGLLTDASGTTVPDGSYSIALGLFTAASGGSAAYAETHTVSTSGGVFSAELGAGAPVNGTWAGLDFTAGYWLETVVAGTTLAPRTRLLASPYARTLAVPGFISGEAPDGRVLTVTNTATTGLYGHGLTAFSADHGESAGLYGVSASTEGTGVVGLAAATSGTNYGVYGESSSASGTGVAGAGRTGVLGSATVGTGVRGETATGLYAIVGISGTTVDSGAGVYGEVTTLSAAASGVRGQSASSSGTGVTGLATSTSGDTYGVYGSSSSHDGIGVYGIASSTQGSVPGAYGVYGESHTPTGAGVYGSGAFGIQGFSSSVSGVGVFAESTALTGFSRGIDARSTSTSGFGVFALATAASGATSGVYGESASTDGTGIHGKGRKYGVYGESDEGIGTGVYGEAGGNFSNGVAGIATSASGFTHGVFGRSDSVEGTGVFGANPSSTGATLGVRGQVDSPDGLGGSFSGGIGVSGLATSPTGFGGYFTGPGTAVYARGGPVAAADLILAGTSGGDDNGNLYSDPAYPSSDLVLAANDDIALHLDENNDETDGSFTISNGTNSVVFSVNESGTVQVSGTTVHTSDRNRKADFSDVNIEAILDGVAGLPMQTWRYRDDPIRHLGPMAQDFSAAFGLGQDDVTIAAVDADGVALAAIQALYRLVQEQQAFARQQQTELNALRERVAHLEANR